MNGLKIKNILIGEYLRLRNPFQYKMAYEFVEPRNSFNSKECKFEALTFDEVSRMKDLYQDQDLGKIKTLYSICYSEEDFVNCKIIDFFQSKKWLDEIFNEAMDKEKKLLARPEDIKEKMAGSDNLTKFKSLNTKMSLGAQFGYEPKIVGAWLYRDVLLYQAHNVTTGEIQKNYAKLK